MNDSLKQSLDGLESAIDTLLAQNLALKARNGELVAALKEATLIVRQCGGYHDTNESFRQLFTEAIEKFEAIIAKGSP